MIRYASLAEIPHPFKSGVVSIGNFDGVHLGHQTILNENVRQAKAVSGVSIVVTFRPHPRVILDPAAPLRLLTSYEAKAGLIAAAGIEHLVEEPFSREFSEQEPRSFFSQSLIRKLGAQSMVVGYDFTFGNMKRGTLDFLGVLCRESGIHLIVVPPLRMEGEVVSSSSIRRYLQEGNVGRAREFLGRSYFIDGVVVRGDGRGRKIGFPTANLLTNFDPPLKRGVYRTQMMVDGRTYPSVTNVGVRPTFDQIAEQKLTVECHVIGEDMDLYGKTLCVTFEGYIREERKFDSVETLKSQIVADIALAQS
ncbi:MAG: bifunctional riboflavin kinase/FAD synthetase [Bdellovibrionota bacterium]